MTPTKTKPDVLAELAKLEADHAERAQTASNLGSKHGAAIRRAEALHSDRRRLIHRAPGLVDHLEQPLEEVKANPIAAIDAELAELPDLDDLTRQRDHARRLAESTRQDLEQFLAASFEALLAALEPEAEAARDRVQAAIAATLAAADEYRRLVDRTRDLAVANPRTDGRNVAALDPVLDLVKAIEGRELPMPTSIR